MISIIICSRDKKQLAAVTTSIKETIGVPYEIIAIDNSAGQYGICAAYNLGAAQSRYDVLCFAHEDLKFHTQNWGSILLGLFSDASIGAIGVAGTTYMPAAPAPWWAAGEKYNRMNVVHTTKEHQEELFNINPLQEALADVVVLDGLWIATRRELWQANPFDAKTFSEFHCYDLDFCLGLFGQARLCVTYAIHIEHFSTGSINSSLIKNIITLYEKRKPQLPAATVAISAPEKKALNAKAWEYLIQIMKDNQYPSRAARLAVFQWLRLAPISRDNFWKLRFFLGLTR